MNKPAVLQQTPTPKRAKAIADQAARIAARVALGHGVHPVRALQIQQDVRNQLLARPAPVVDISPGGPDNVRRYLLDVLQQRRTAQPGG